MIKLLQEITKEFRKITPESYYDTNRSDEVRYPYFTFDLSSEDLERNVEGFYIDIDIFDSSTSYINLFELEGQIKNHFKDLVILTDDLLLRFSYLRGDNMPTGDDVIIRRNIQLYCKVDWRNG